MKQKFIPLEKRSKREQREYHTSKRKGWGELNPITKMIPNKKIYNRKKSAQRYKDEPIARIFYIDFSLPSDSFIPEYESTLK